MPEFDLGVHPYDDASDRPHDAIGCNTNDVDYTVAADFKLPSTQPVAPRPVRTPNPHITRAAAFAELSSDDDDEFRRVCIPRDML